MSVLEKIGETIHIEWKIPDLFAEEEEEGHIAWYHSPTFNFCNVTWCILLGADGQFLTGVDHSSLILMSKENCNYTIEYKLGLKKVDGTVEIVDKGILKNEKIHSTHLQLSSLAKHMDQYAPSNIFTITCSLLINIQAPKAVQIKELNKIDTLSKNLEDFYANKIDCDIVLRVQDKEFFAHKAILVARSKVFEAMLQHHTLEYQTGVITIPDCEPNSFQHFLEYLYSGKLEELSYSCILNLFETSEKYQVMELKSHCTEYLIQNLELENLYDIIALAEMYGEEKLFLAAQNVFNKNFTQIVHSSDWEELLKNDYTLANKLLKGFNPDQKNE